MTNKFIKHTIVFTLALALAAFARPTEKLSDSLSTPKNLENYNEFQVEKWGPVTYSGAGKCDILDLYQKSVLQGLGYSTVVDYHYKQIKDDDKYTCESWGLGLGFKVVQDTNKYSENYQLPANTLTQFSAQTQDAVKKYFSSDSAFLEVERIVPVTHQAPGKCYEVDFLFSKADEQSGFHGIVDIKFDESMIGGEPVCTFWGLAVKYKKRSVIEKVVTKKRVIEVIKVPKPKPDTIRVPVPSPSAPQKNNCCMICSCNN